MIEKNKIKQALISYGITDVQEIIYNPSYEELFEDEVPVRARLWLLYAGFCVWRRIHRAKLPLQILVVPRLRHHGGVVCRVRKWRNMHFPTMPSSQIYQRIAQSAIGAHATGHGYLFHAQIFGGFLQLVDKDIDNCLL